MVGHFFVGFLCAMTWFSGLGIRKLTHWLFPHLCSLWKGKARSLEDETRNGERNTNWNPEWWADLGNLVKIEKIKFLGISRYKVELRFWLHSNSEVSRGTNLNWDFCLIWICSWPKSPHHSGFRFVFLSPIRVSSSRERAVCSWVFHFVKWMNRFLYYDLDRFACVRIPTQIQIDITIQI